MLFIFQYSMSKNWPKDRKCDPETGYCPDTYSCDYCNGLIDMRTPAQLAEIERVHSMDDE